MTTVLTTTDSWRLEARDQTRDRGVASHGYQHFGCQAVPESKSVSDLQASRDSERADSQQDSQREVPLDVPLYPKAKNADPFLNGGGAWGDTVNQIISHAGCYVRI